MKTSEQGVDFVKRWEGFRPKPYFCAGGKLTWGFGTTEDVKIDGTITREEADLALRKRLAENDREIARLVQVPLTQGQWDAVASLVYNIGIGNFAQSTLRRLINRGEMRACVPEFIKYRKSAKGEVIPGLAARRVAEAKLWIGEVEEPAPPPAEPVVLSVSAPEDQKKRKEEDSGRSLIRWVFNKVEMLWNCLKN
jgi:lysozyme